MEPLASIKCNNKVIIGFRSSVIILLVLGGIAFPSISPVDAISVEEPAIRLLVILVDFPNVKYTKSIYEIGHLVFERVNRYVKEASYGRACFEGTVLNWMQAPQNLSFYGDDERGVDWNAPMLIRDATELAASKVFLNDYEHIIIVHAGPGQETSGNASDVWSACWMGLSIQVDDREISTAVLIPEYEVANVDPLGPYAHEILHAMGLQDTGGNLGRWDVMGRGAYNGDPSGSSPTHPCAYSKIQLGWINASQIVTVMTSSVISLSSIEALSSGPMAVKVPLQPSRYYLIEMREQKDLDSNPPSSTLLITLVEERADISEWDVQFFILKDYERCDGLSSEKVTINTSFRDNQSSTIELSILLYEPKIGHLQYTSNQTCIKIISNNTDVSLK